MGAGRGRAVFILVATCLSLALAGLPVGPMPQPSSPPSKILRLPARAESALGHESALSLRPALSTNSSPVPEVGTIIGNVSGGTDPWGGFYDPPIGAVFATDFGDSQVTLLQGLRSLGTLSVGQEPIGGTYDPADGYAYVSNYMSNDVSVFAGLLPAGTIPVPAGPWGMTYNPVNQEVYVASYGSNTVSIISDRGVVTTLGVGSEPEGVAFDNANGNVYVVNHGSDNVSVIDDRRVVANIPVGHLPEGAAFDSASGTVDVTNNFNGTVTILQGTAAIRTLRVGASPASTAFDPGNGLMYVGNEGSGNLSVLNATAVIATIPVGSCPYAVVFDPQDGAIYAENCNPGSVAVVSTMLAERWLSSTPVGSPANSTDVGLMVRINGNVWAVGTGNDSGSTRIRPTVGLNCSPMSLTLNSSAEISAQFNCTATFPGDYAIWINVTDSRGSSVWAKGSLQVYVDPTLTRPAARSDSGSPITSADAGQRVTFTTQGTGGTGNYSWVWLGLALGSCLGLDTNGPVCIFPVAAALSIQAVLTDSDGKGVFSSALPFRIYSDPIVRSLLPSTVSADIGQSVNFSATSESGSGGESFTWYDAPPGCSITNLSEIHCTFASAGTFLLTTQVVDSNGRGSSPGPGARIEVYSDPEVASPAIAQPPLFLGANSTITVTVQGGLGPYLFVWYGLPPGCGGSSMSVRCHPTQAGEYQARVAVTDANGFTVLSNVTTLSVSGPSIGTHSGGNGPSVVFGIPALWLIYLVAIVTVGSLCGIVAVRSRRGSQLEDREAIEHGRG